MIPLTTTHTVDTTFDHRRCVRFRGAENAMRILTLSRDCTLDDAGNGTSVHALSSELCRLGHEVAVLPCDTEPGAAAPDCQWLDHSPAPYAQAARAYFAGEWLPDLIHAHDMRSGPAALRLTDAADVPLVLSVPTTEPDEHLWPRSSSEPTIDPRQRMAMRRADLLVVCSVAMRRKIAAAYRLDPASIEVLRHGVDLKTWHKMPIASTWAGQLYNPDRSPLLLTFGRLDEAAGVQDLVSAMPLIRRAHPGTRLVVAGDGSYRKTLCEQATRYGLAAVTTFPGELNLADLRAAIGAADVVVLPGQPTCDSAVLWTAAVGTPLVASRAGAPAEVILDGSTGRLCQPGSVADLADAVSAELNDPALAQAHAEAAKAKVRAEFGLRAIAERSAELYRATVHRYRTAAGLLPRGT
ncbi:glycosyltransferase family 4 protein [Nocardia sp. NPDC046473]|uniref:glycosyltransferase family 4 protein n=1 Tax=Nocardia sp. NPDC046473 TaxID=3155733 RepID=UPI0033E542ED